MNRLAVAGVVAACVVAGGGVAWMLADSGSRPVVKSGERPNVVLVMWDTVRADRLSVYGYERPTTPRLEGRAARGRVFEAAMSPGMWTVPSHASVFTGLPASSTGAHARWIWLDGHHTTMAEHFGAAGYATYAFSSNPYLSPASNLLQGFDEVHLTWDGEYAKAAADVTEAKLIAEDGSSEISPAWTPSGAGKGWPEHLTAYKDAAPVIVDAFLGWATQQEEPFFVYLNFLEAHHPRVPSAAARAAVMEPERVEKGFATDGSLFHTMAAMEGKHIFEPAEVDALSGIYDATLVDLDQATDALFAGLEEAGLSENTIVVLYSDHGEHLGEHGMWDHRWSVEQPLLHVPLMMWGPGVEPGRVSETVSTRNLFGELLALTGLTPPAVSHALPRVEDEAGTAFSELVLPTPRLPFINKAYPNLPPKRWARRYHVGVSGAEKFVRASDRQHAYFDLAADGAEDNNLMTARPKDANRMFGVVKAWADSVPKYDPSQRASGDHPKNAMAASAELSEQLKLLGYAEDDEGEEP